MPHFHHVDAIHLGHKQKSSVRAGCHRAHVQCLAMRCDDFAPGFTAQHVLIFQISLWDVTSDHNLLEKQRKLQQGQCKPVHASGRRDLLFLLPSKADP